MCSIPNIIRLVQSLTKRWTGHVARMGEKRIEDSVMVGKTDRDHLRPKRRWEDNVKVDLTEGGGEDVDWIHLAQARHV